MRATAIVGLGSNLGSREALLREAARLLGEDPELALEARSRLYLTPPVGPPQPDYLNAALRVATALAPEALLDRLLAVERRLGRVRDVRWGPRTVDLDVLWWSGGAVRTPRLEIPHPGLEARAFALAPLLDVAPELAATHGPALEAAGGAPPTRPWSEVTAGPEGLEITAADAADALALASAAWTSGDRLEPLEARDPAAFVGAGGRVVLAWEADVIRGLGGGGRPAASVRVGDAGRGVRCRIHA